MSQQFISEVRKVMSKAEAMFGLDLSKVKVRVDIRGYRTAGQAGYKTKYGTRQYYLRFHPRAVSLYYDQMVKNTIPHEVAHTVCQMNPALGCNHNQGWKNVCRMLGGDANRIHTMNLHPGSTGGPATCGTVRERSGYMYACQNGNTIILSAIRHRRLQNGQVRAYTCPVRGRILPENYMRAV